ncbi:MAG TPA: thiol:disulfide interchange protein DsbA/DsbL [Candidatus Thiothrix moscowensis]|uniref:thiol:disulfide interchange protein DsbA/DsbL n=1 Tax=unclassified Thiothrix TaxID=2636184 RepID=UPI001A1FF29E|nr:MULTISPECIES: thiol:disulfide interchange protein DsbA/DsbL [unclassified Thiothrix]MBJ6611057.1 thiol:disulfide interchange protein DsbA/DsbL [Candidatus Thiothrix moscowensis]HRJ53490.1 thiol:disulfide interchange protein DsbA/DsbL [Candidatus Thiothrix moscowensis]HRJ93569.1 thiol:disulfide interchange protein DsbA/DsbL [Candidatus Thiothrix moscowensis]
MKRVFSRAFGLLMALFLITGCVPESSHAEDFKEGTHYKVISPAIPIQNTEGKAEVLELFWYGCPHCLSLEPTIEKFLKQKPDNVVFQRVPAMLSPRWTFHAKLFYVGQMLDPKGEKEIHGKIFNAVQTQRRKIDNDDALRRFFTENGFGEEQVNNVLKSMELNAVLTRADEIGHKSKADSVPAIIVNGKYLTSPSMLGSEEKLLQVIDFLSKQGAK